MSVTQDYKILTLTRTEVQAVRHALQDRITDLTQILLGADENEVAVLQNRLAEAQSAYDKVRA